MNMVWCLSMMEGVWRTLGVDRILTSTVSEIVHVMGMHSEEIAIVSGACLARRAGERRKLGQFVVL